MAGSSGRGYTHFNKVSGKQGLYVGAAGSEVQIADSTGDIGTTSWASWSPTLTWTTGTPASLTTVARYKKVGKTVFFTFHTTSADANGATQLTVTLPETPADINSYVACSGYQLQNTTYYDCRPYIDATDNTAGNRVLTFRSFQTATDAQTVTIAVSGFYEIA